MASDDLWRAKRLSKLSTARRVWPNDSPENLTRGLIELCQDWIQPEHRMAEIGCFAGVSTEIFALFAGTVYAIDPWTQAGGYNVIPRGMLLEAQRQFLAMMAHYPNIRRMPCTSAEAAEEIADQTLDAVYIDGDHQAEAVATDLVLWWPKLKPGGLLMGHDFSMAEPILAEAGLKAEKVYWETSWVVKIPHVCTSS